MDIDGIAEFLKITADEVINPRFRQLSDGDIEEKRPGDLVTIADREAEDHLAAQLRTAYPDATIVGEETVFLGTSATSMIAEAEHAFVIDPIDGTRNFVHGNPEHGVMLAEVRKGVTTRGWIWQPHFDRMYTVEKGAGDVLINGKPAERSAKHKPPLGASGSRYVGFDGGGKLQPTIHSSGAACFDYPNTMAGDIDFMYFSNAHPWDHLAGALMLAETGGTARMLSGEDYSASTSGKGLLIARTIEIWELVAPLLK